MTTSSQHPQLRHILAVFATPAFLGMAPIFGRMSIMAGATPFSVAAIRTLIAIGLLWLLYLIFWRRYIYIYPAGLMGCVVIGTVNGIGSLFYYGGLGALDNASLVQLLNGMYMAFAVLISRMVGQKTDKHTLLRVGLATMALFLITAFDRGDVNWLGVGLMLGSALMFAGTLILSQYVVYEMPSPTATLYILSTMGVVVLMVWMAVGDIPSVSVLENALLPMTALGVTTALSRLAMFAGVKFMGGVQMAVVAITEIAVALTLAFFVLDERLTLVQWSGVALLFFVILLIRERDLLPRGFNPNQLIVANMASVQFQRIAFHQAFGTREHGDDVLGPMSTQEMLTLQKMLGAESGGIDPFPIGKLKVDPREIVIK
ncbi:MAG: hypothetical protein OHK0046_49230 [Anaerolineae bacterium]